MGARLVSRRADRTRGAAPPRGEPGLRILAVLGPTAAGKSELAVALAGGLGGEILSVDSMQVYREMDVGTAKPHADVRRRVPHHLIDLVDPDQAFSVAEFQQAGLRVLEALETAGRAAVIAGGSGLHFRSLVDPMTFRPTDPDLRRALEATDPGLLVGELLAADPAAGVHVDLANPRRVLRAVEVHRLLGETPSRRAESAEGEALRTYAPARPFVAVGLDPGEALAARVEARLDAMLAAGLLEEVAALADRLGPTARQAVGYKELLPVVAGETPLEQGREAALRATLALAKRQRTFFRRDPRIHWLPWHDGGDARLEEAQAVLREVAAWSS